MKILIFTARDFWIFLIIGSCLLHSSLEASTNLNQILQMDANVRVQSEKKVLLEVNIKNAGSKEIVIPSGYLPWDRYGMTLIITSSDPSSRPIDQELVIADPIPGEPHKLKAGEALKGRIDLTDRFPGLARLLKRTDAIVFWSYCLEEEVGNSFKRVGGWKVIPRQR